jgi:hypothetical protein
MSTHPFIETLGRRTRTRKLAARLLLISSLGPSAMLAGAVWAVLQPYRITLLHPRGQSFWWLVVEPPILVVVAGLLFHVFVGRALVDDLRGVGDAAAR